MSWNALTFAQIEELIWIAESRAAKGIRDGFANPVAASNPHVPDAEWQQLVSAIEELSGDAQVELMAFMWLGDGTFADLPDCWDEIIQFARCQVGEDFPFRVAETPKLHSILRHGMDMVGQVGMQTA